MQRSNEKIFRAILIISIIVACAGSLVLILLLSGVPRRVEQVFGPASPQLNLWRRIDYTFKLYNNQKDLQNPKDPQGASMKFTVDGQESVATMAQRMEADGLISNADLFITYLIYTGDDTLVKAGTFYLSPSQSMVEIAGVIKDISMAQITFRVFPGWRIEEIASALGTSGINIGADEFIDAAKTHPKIKPAFEGGEEVTSLEGYLFPDQYEMLRKISTDELITLMVDNFNTHTNPEWITAVQGKGLSVPQAVTLASIIQREAVISDEMPIMASVFYNRLAQGMKLESDPTAQYALGYQIQGDVWWKSNLTLEDLKVDSLYNTYINTGLPPGPIGNPGLEALQAVATPSSTEYLYFRSACDGSGRHNFSKTFEEHLNAACQ